MAIEVYAICKHYFFDITKKCGERAFSDRLLSYGDLPDIFIAKSNYDYRH